MQNEPVHVLLADDDEDDRNFFIDALNELKINTVISVVKDGKELINHLSQTDISLPHVLFLDINMPYKSGIDCLNEIKKNDRLKDIAIAIYSTSGSEKDIEETFIKGANVYIKKPDSFPLLKKVLSQVITLNWQYHTSGLNRDTFLLSL
ncbi:response regulator [Emticicia sp. SJ17W-69]|uniref:response regulator n=1 Tax=Emticicia sp. SJ17W-69 TaxID=3421657 RepID=UPI003EBEAF38